MEINEKFLKELLVDSGIIDPKNFDRIKKEAAKDKHPLQDLLIKKKLISDRELGLLVADKIGFPFIDLKRIKIDKKILEIVPEIVARKQEIVVFDKTKNGIKVAMTQPENLETREFIERKTGEKVIPYYATSLGIKESLKFYKRDIKEEFEELIKKALETLKSVPRKPEAPDFPITKMVDLILRYGYENRASDIHFEPYSKEAIIRYRIDGILHDVLTFPKELHDYLVGRIKILAKLRTDIHDVPQDGHFSFSLPEEKMDVRVSVIPISSGEKIALRLLSEKVRRFDLQELGLIPRDLKIVLKNIKKPWGMILVSGPTGCGKTTTLYATLKTLNVREVNIMTIEDPIEYGIEGANQIQVNPKTGLTFSQGLRSIIRQDPDIIMVGEMRDPETAKLAVNAAMTGHLVLSTFHATDAPTVLLRLFEMGIEPFLITSCLNLVIAQRLVRKICPKCIESYETSFSKVLTLFGKKLTPKLPVTKKKIRLFRGKGCKICFNTGYLGRTGIFEVLEMSEPIAELVVQRAPVSRIRAEAIKLGMTTLIEDGLKKMEEGITTLAEVVRAVK